MYAIIRVLIETLIVEYGVIPTILLGIVAVIFGLVRYAMEK